ncbi:GNAT family N-acetyltransferase [Catellatospora tritici]|uniref:GNAT family N-acetyltransferase n=1 Tax=Catellatospora tritici TaxID=2851566 RepID=UPI001C2DDB55|nr:GNAT family N-acetyltransferase [Catellatospora tritici]MBV1855310.1 GNAT family N-acetyltransferase [Catellatospora tritici]
MPTVRPATAADLPGVRAVADRFGNLAHWPRRPDYLDREQDNGRLWVGVRDGAVVGFGGTTSRGALTHLADLFVLPEHQSSGVGQALLARLLPAGAPRVTFASSDPRAIALYTRQGLLPRCPVLYLSGRLAPLPPSPPALRVTAADLTDLDAVASGGARPADLTWYGELPEVSAWRTGDGYALVRTVGDELLLGPAGGATPEDCAAAVLAALAAHRDLAAARLTVFGPNPVLPLLLGYGFLVTDMDVFAASEPDTLPLDRYLPHPDLG